MPTAGLRLSGNPTGGADAVGRPDAQVDLALSVRAELRSDGLPLQSGAVPLREIGAGLVRRTEELAECLCRIVRRPHFRIGQNELAEALVEAAVRHLGVTISGSFWIDVAVEERLRRRRSSRPKAGAGDFIAICLTRNPVWQAWHPTRVPRRLTAREQARRQVEAAPPEVHRAGLAGEACAEPGEHRQHRRKRLAEARGRVAI